MKAAPESQEQVGAAQLGWGAVEQGPQVTEKGVGQEVALAAGSRSSPQAAESLPQVEASVTNSGVHVGEGEKCWKTKG